MYELLPGVPGGTGGGGWFGAVLVGSVWFRLVLRGSGWFCLVLSGSVRFWLVLCGSGWFCSVLAGSVWFWLVLCGSGWFFVVLLRGFVWFCTVLAGSGWFCVVLAVWLYWSRVRSYWTGSGHTGAGSDYPRGRDAPKFKINPFKKLFDFDLKSLTNRPFFFNLWGGVLAEATAEP